MRTRSKLALGAIAGPVLLTLAWFVLGFVSPGYSLWGTRIAPYSAISQPLSGLGLGPTGPYMNAAFVLDEQVTASGGVDEVLVEPVARGWTHTDPAAGS